MWVIVNFSNYSGGVEGLSPTIKIRYVEDGSVVSSGVMSNIGYGFYKYDFSEYDLTRDYLISCDAVALPDLYRYKNMSTGEYGDRFNDILLVSDTVDTRSVLIRKILSNKMVSSDGESSNLVVYDDDDSTVLVTWDAKDVYGGGILHDTYTDAVRSRGI